VRFLGRTGNGIGGRDRFAAMHVAASPAAPALHRPWSVAKAVGLLAVSDEVVTAGPMLPHCPSAGLGSAPRAFRPVQVVN
jgi:hypothetical protein